MVKKVFLIIIYTVLSNLTFAQNSEAGSWYIYFGNQKLNKKINWHNEIQWRNYDFGSDLEQLLIRTGLGYDLTENNNNIMLGYGFIHSQIYNQNNSDKTQTNEHRVFQQLITKSSFGRYYLQHRYRVEERFISSEFKMRYRYFLGINIPVNKKQMENNSVYISSYNEIFLNSHGKIFDRNRLYVALGYAITNKLKFEAGMMAQMYENRYRPQFQFVIFNNFDFYKN